MRPKLNEKNRGFRMSKKILLTGLLSCCATAGAWAATTYDLATDWSTTENPNGVWSLDQGSTPLQSISNFNFGGSIGIDVTAWAPSNSGGGFLPARNRYVVGRRRSHQQQSGDFFRQLVVRQRRDRLDARHSLRKFHLRRNGGPEFHRGRDAPRPATRIFLAHVERLGGTCNGRAQKTRQIKQGVSV